MICPYCGQEQSICIDSRQKGLERNRTYSCRACKKRYYTKELLLSSSTRVEDAKEELENTLNALRAALRGADSALKFLGSKEGVEE
jgi:transcriptional regulator NrdR family protein